MERVFIVTLLVSVIVFGPGKLSAGEPSESSEGGESDQKSKLPIGPILMGSYGLVTIAMGAGFGLQAYQENEDFNKEEDGQYPLASESLADDITAHSIAANVLMFSGLAVVLGGILWWALDDDYHSKRAKKEQKAALRLRPLIGPTQTGVAAAF
jgi:hypothetical protein